MKHLFQPEAFSVDLPHCCYVSLGSNMGNPLENLAKARTYLAESVLLPEMAGSSALPALLKASSVYWTEPQGMKDQPFFANQVIKLSCAQGVTPAMMLHRLLAIEQKMGRVRTVRFGPRVIDLDLLLFDDAMLETEELVLPHPRMFERAFVLVPLLEVAPDLALPCGAVVSEMVKQIRYTVHDNVIHQH